MELVSYDLAGAVATLTMDDGKVNVLSPAMQQAIHAGFDRAEADGAEAVVLAGRDGVFSAGFDLGILRGGGPAMTEMVAGGFELAGRVLAFPRPVAMACTGHAVAMGLFLMFSGDYRVGAAGPFTLRANEVAIGLTMPWPAIQILRLRLVPAVFDRAVGLSEAFSPADAPQTGFLDRVVEPAGVVAAAQEVAASLTSLDQAAHQASKQRVRAAALDAIRAEVEAARAHVASG
jgi:enoyl-CoA hydratase/carnithine racemase